MKRINLTKRHKTKGLSTLKKKCWKLVSLIVRLGAADHRGLVVCYTCGQTMHWKESQCGHGIGGRHNAVLLDEEILRPQCVGCNIFKHGNYPIFVTKLIQENGMDWWESKLQQSRALVKYTRGDYIVKIEEYQTRLADLENRNVA